MTPLELEIAIHYATKGGDYRDGDFSAKAVMEAICWFAKEGMLELCKLQGPMCQKYQATDKLKFFVNHLCTIQLPVCSWEIPTALQVLEKNSQKLDESINKLKELASQEKWVEERKNPAANAYRPI